MRPDCQPHGLGSRLVPEALRRLRAQGGAGCVVLGEPDYYGRFGFAAINRRVLPGVTAEYFQSVAFDAAGAAGNVSYPAAFDA